MDDTKAIALSDFSFFSKIIMAFTWLLKSCVVFSIFFALIPLKYFLYMENKNDYMLLFIGAILAYSIAFLIYYIISEGILKEMILGFVLTIIGSAIAFFYSARRNHYCNYRGNFHDKKNNIFLKNDSHASFWIPAGRPSFLRRALYGKQHIFQQHEHTFYNTSVQISPPGYDTYVCIHGFDSHHIVSSLF